MKTTTNKYFDNSESLREEITRLRAKMLATPKPIDFPGPADVRMNHWETHMVCDALEELIELRQLTTRSRKGRRVVT